MLVRAVLFGVVLRQVRGRGWSEPESLRARAVPYLREGFARGETVVAVVSADVQQVLRAALGDDATRMHWQADNVSYARLGAMFEGFRRFLADQRAAGVALRPLAQNDTAGAPHRMAAYLRIEAMANEVLGAFGYPWACLYDTRAHSRQTLRDAHQTHPAVGTTDAGGPARSATPLPGRLQAYPSWYRRAPAGPGALGGSVVDVGFADTFTTRVQKLRGRMKRNAGAVSGDRRLEAEGRTEEVRGSLKQAGEKFKAAFRGRGGRRPRD